jgi:molybdopterin molybdotransferase
MERHAWEAMTSARRKGNPEVASLLVEPAPLETAWRWIEENAQRLDAESVDLEAAYGRVPVGPLLAPSDVPARSSAIEDGYAVRAEATVGAGPYNPLSFPVVEAADRPLPQGAAARIKAAQPLPAGADAILACDFVAPESEGRISILASVAAGDGVVIAGSELRAGEPLWRAERDCRTLSAAEIGLLSAAGIAQVPVVRRPRTRILLADVAGAVDVPGPMLRALVRRDGGQVIGIDRLDSGRVRVAELVAGADVILIVRAVERSSCEGIDAIVAGDAEMAIRGVAIEPGRETCLARLDRVIVALLPDRPAACFWSYELVAGRAIRCTGGRDPGFPCESRRLQITRKIASPLGLTEAVPVRFDPAEPGAVMPFPHGPSPRLRNAASADGFVLVPATSEGAPAGSKLPVWLFERPGEGVSNDG